METLKLDSVSEIKIPKKFKNKIEINKKSNRKNIKLKKIQIKNFQSEKNQ